MIKRYVSIFALFVIIFYASCDILRNSPFEVLEWSPGGGYHGEPENISVSLLFSRDPDRTSVEKNFSLRSDSEQIKGIFQWEDKKMRFLPFISLELNKDYFVRVSSGAHDEKGLSMDRDFDAYFSTRSDFAHPCIISFSPGMEGYMIQSRGLYSVKFSLPISLNSLRDNVSFSPPIPGAWNLEEGGTLAVFTPSEPWPQGKYFELRLSAGLKGQNGMGMGSDFFAVFTTGLEHELPLLTGAWRVSADCVQHELSLEMPNEFVENSGWEKDDRLRLLFSVRVDLISLQSAVSTEGGPSLALEMPPVIPNDPADSCFFDEVFFHFEKQPVFKGRFLLRIKQGVKDVNGNESNQEYFYRIFADGKNSRPPELVGIRLPMSPANTLDVEEDGDPDGDPTDKSDHDYRLYTYGMGQLFDDLPIESEFYPYYTKTATWIECYFDCADKASVDVFSLMELFNVETSNSVITFTPLAVRTGNFSVLAPHPEWERYQRLEISGSLTNTTNAGLVHFVVNKGLKDSIGNISDRQFRISLIK